MMFAVDAYSIWSDPAMRSRREEILAWLRAHDLDPDRVYAVRVVGPCIRVVEFELDDQGQKVLRDGDPAMRVRWKWLRERPPP